MEKAAGSMNRIIFNPELPERSKFQGLHRDMSLNYCRPFDHLLGLLMSEFESKQSQTRFIIIMETDVTVTV